MPDRYSTLHLIEDQYEPGSNGTVLRNLLGIRSKEEMERVEEERFGRLMEWIWITSRWRGFLKA